MVRACGRVYKKQRSRVFFPPCCLIHTNVSELDVRLISWGSWKPLLNWQRAVSSISEHNISRTPTFHHRPHVPERSTAVELICWVADTNAHLRVSEEDSDEKLRSEESILGMPMCRFVLLLIISDPPDVSSSQRFWDQTNAAHSP